MNGNDVERELRDFFVRAHTPEPSAALRGATAAARLRAAPVRRGGTRDARMGLALVGLAASIALVAGALMVVSNHKGSTTLGPGGSASPSAQTSMQSSVPTSMHTFGPDPSPRPSPEAARGSWSP